MPYPCVEIYTAIVKGETGCILYYKDNLWLREHYDDLMNSDHHISAIQKTNS